MQGETVLAEVLFGAVRSGQVEAQPLGQARRLGDGLGELREALGHITCTSTARGDERGLAFAPRNSYTRLFVSDEPTGAEELTSSSPLPLTGCCSSVGLATGGLWPSGAVLPGGGPFVYRGLERWEAPPGGPFGEA